MISVSLMRNRLSFIIPPPLYIPFPSSYILLYYTPSSIHILSILIYPPLYTPFPSSSILLHSPPLSSTLLHPPPPSNSLSSSLYTQYHSSPYLIYRRGHFLTQLLFNIFHRVSFVYLYAILCSFYI